MRLLGFKIERERNPEKEQRRRAGRIRRLEDDLADAKHELDLWGNHFGTSPSRKRRMEEDVQRLEEALREAREES